jgi:nitroimidazol reductase NimA-like FMN-containing flavoprotein (pyridoxamine 5'-phosphate oxidase superfamily)
MSDQEPIHAAATMAAGAAVPSRLEPTERTRVRRVPMRGVYEREALYAILDAGLVAHVGFCDEAGDPVVLPMAYARLGDELLLHGSTRARMLALVERGARLCVTVTHLDGLVLARSAFHHSVNYRSAVVFGRPRLLETEQEKGSALAAFTDKLVAGRWDAVRPPTATELRVTAVAALAIEEASAKVRTGGPLDDPGDIALPIWAGVLPLVVAPGAPEPASDLAPGIALPEHVARAADSIRRRAEPGPARS